MPKSQEKENTAAPQGNESEQFAAEKPLVRYSKEPDNIAHGVSNVCERAKNMLRCVVTTV
jgi:hypothetical protein